jgi:hypothetical protein
MGQGEESGQDEAVMVSLWKGAKLQKGYCAFWLCLPIDRLGLIGVRCQINNPPGFILHCCPRKNKCDSTEATSKTLY